MSCCALKFVPEAGGEYSTERVEILLPSGKGHIQYILAHSVREAINADCWHLIAANYVEDAAVFPLTRRGEWETAVKLTGRDDFSGGTLHGDEISQGARFFLDGDPIDPNDLTEGVPFTELVVKESGRLYDPADHQTVIALRDKTYTFTADGMTVDQHLIWQIDASTENCFLAMLPVLKTVAKTSWTDADPVEKPIVYGEFEGVRSVTLTDGTFWCEFSIPNYPQKMPYTLCVTDNGGLPYHKHYFYAAKEGHRVTAGETWDSRTVYRIRYQAP